MDAVWGSRSKHSLLPRAMTALAASNGLEIEAGRHRRPSQVCSNRFAHREAGWTCCSSRLGIWERTTKNAVVCLGHRNRHGRLASAADGNAIKIGTSLGGRKRCVDGRLSRRQTCWSSCRGFGRAASGCLRPWRRAPASCARCSRTPCRPSGRNWRPDPLCRPR